MYECSQTGCKQTFDSLNQLEIDLDLSSHQQDTKAESESLYDNIRILFKLQGLAIEIIDIQYVPGNESCR